MSLLKRFAWMVTSSSGEAAAKGGSPLSIGWPMRVLLVWAMLLIPSIPPFRSLGSVTGWVRPYYYVSYTDLGFIKRGFLGTVLTLTGLNRVFPVTMTVVLAHILFSLVLAVLMVVLFRLAFGGRPPRWTIPVQISALLSPALFMRIGFDTGRMDLVCLILALLVLLGTVLFPLGVPLAMGVGILLVLQLLIHDTSLLMYIPFELAFVCWRFGAAGQLRSLVVASLVAPLLLGCLAVFVWGRYEPGQPGLDAYLSSLSPDLKGGFSMELTSSLADNMKLAADNLEISSALGGTPLVGIYYFVVAAGFWYLTRLPFYLKLSCLSPLLLNALGPDPVRWLGSSLTLFVILFLLAARVGQIRVPPERLAWLLLVALIPFTAFGPWGTGGDDPLPLLRYFR